MIDSVSEPAAASAGPDLKKSRRQKTSSRSGAGKVDRLPPHSLEAEQGVLGCILLSPNESLGDCVEKLKDDGKEAFYDLRHQTIYETLAEMFNARDPIDLITVQQNLKDRQLLEQVGGLAYLAQLQDAVPSAANLGYYLEIVREKYLLRRMIQTCSGVVAKIYDFEGEVDALLDEVEKEVLRVNESRAQGDVQGVKELVNHAIGTIENFFNRKGELSGLATGFPDFDKMTDGLHGGEMIVIAARPSMGKTSLAMNIAEHRRPRVENARGSFQPGNERRIAGAAHDVLDRARQPPQYPGRFHERSRFSQAAQRRRPALSRQAFHRRHRRTFHFADARPRPPHGPAARHKAFCG